MLWGWKGKIPKLLRDDAYKKHCISTNISRIWTMEYLNRISMISDFINANPVVQIGQAVVELLQFLQQTRVHDENVFKGWSQELLYLHQY
jgi:hypothetical protein